MPPSNDSFKKPGSIPFNWEIQPGIPKLQPIPIPLPQHHHPNHSLRLKPPPASSARFSTRQVQPEPHTGSFRVPFSPRQQCNSSTCNVMSMMCFPSSSWFKFLKKERKKKKIQQGKCDHDYYSDTDTFSFRSSFSTRKSSSFQSPFRGTTPSPFSSSFSSFRSSPQPVKDDDVDWANVFMFF